MAWYIAREACCVRYKRILLRRYSLPEAFLYELNLQLDRQWLIQNNTQLSTAVKAVISTDPAKRISLSWNLDTAWLSCFFKIFRKIFIRIIEITEIMVAPEFLADANPYCSTTLYFYLKQKNAFNFFCFYCSIVWLTKAKAKSTSP